MLKEQALCADNREIKKNSKMFHPNAHVKRKKQAKKKKVRLLV